MKPFKKTFLWKYFVAKQPERNVFEQSCLMSRKLSFPGLIGVHCEYKTSFDLKCWSEELELKDGGGGYPPMLTLPEQYWA